VASVTAQAQSKASSLSASAAIWVLALVAAIVTAVFILPLSAPAHGFGPAL
jgi:hypothetical protein